MEQENSIFPKGIQHFWRQGLDSTVRGLYALSEPHGTRIALYETSRAREETGVSVVTASLTCRTRGDGDTVDLTFDLAEAVRKSGLMDGVATLFMGGSTAGITTIEYEPGAVSDLQDVFEELAPRGRDWRHHLRWGDHNGHSHVRAAMLGPSLSVPFVGRELALGTWQQVVLVDFDDRSRTREVVVQMIGE